MDALAGGESPDGGEQTLRRPAEHGAKLPRVLHDCGRREPAFTADDRGEPASLAYPYAIEHAGHLYVGYSNSGGGVGRVGTGRELWNNNSAELAVIPIAALQVP